MSSDHDEQFQKFSEIVRQLDCEDLQVILLMMKAFTRRDRRLAVAIGAYAKIPRQERSDTRCNIDFELAGRIGAVCTKDESLNWGRALTACVLRGDQKKASALQNLMRRRVAS